MSLNLIIVQGAMRVLYYHGYSLARALSELFPEVQFDPAKFNMLCKFFCLLPFHLSFLFFLIVSFI